MASAEYEAFIKAFTGTLVDHTDPVDVVLEKMHAIHPTSCRETTRVEPVEIGGIEASWIATPENLDSDRVLIHVHGGAFVSTIVQHYLDYGDRMSEHFSARVLCFQYRWAQDAPYPAALEDTLACVRGVYDSGVDPQRVAFVGDSCGGGIAIAAACALRDAGDPLPACIVGFTPWLDAEQTGDSAVHPRGLDPFVEAKWIRERFKNYAGAQGDLHDPLISPIRSKLDGLPPIYLAVGGFDTTADDSIRLAARARSEGANVIVDVSGEMVHGFVGLSGQFPEATQAMARAAAFVQGIIR